MSLGMCKCMCKRIHIHLKSSRGVLITCLFVCFYETDDNLMICLFQFVISDSAQDAEAGGL